VIIMSFSCKIKALKRDCLKLFQLKDEFQKYKNKANKIADKIGRLKLDQAIDSGELRFFLVHPVKDKKVSDLSYVEFCKSIDEYFRVKKIDYYFQIIELKNFPKNYRLGHGTLFAFASLPPQVKGVAKNLSKGKVTSVQPSIQPVWEQIVQKLMIPTDPKVGHWLKISVSVISSTTSWERAFEYAEESLDILRMVISTARFHLPQHAIALDTHKNKAFPVAKGIQFSKYPYNPRHQKLIDRLNDVYVKAPTKLERRIKNAIHFLRIADNNSPDYQRILFYVAAIENLILGRNDRGALGLKFRQKGAILLADKPKKRLDLVIELKKMYKKRSETAHGGKSDYDFFLTTSSRHYLREIIMKIMHLIDKHKLRTVVRKEEKPGQSLDEYVDNIIYSG
jgi:hypothetical protein